MKAKSVLGNYNTTRIKFIGRNDLPNFDIKDNKQQSSFFKESKTRGSFEKVNETK